MIVHSDCLHFDGYKPCGPHKLSGVHCGDCAHYAPSAQDVLVLKLGAAGEVVRCTPILRRLRAQYPGAAVHWVTRHPELVPREWVHGLWPWGWETAEWAKARPWDLVLSLDKEPAACALARGLRAGSLKGFVLDDHGHVAPADADARHKWLTGVFDDLMRQNHRHYIEEIFEVCGWRYAGERYVLPAPEPVAVEGLADSGPIVGLNTGAGAVWPTRIWPAEHFAGLARALRARGLRVWLLGGPDEHERNVRLARSTDAEYFGVWPLRQFMSLVARCNVVVTSVTLALHLAIGLQRRVVLLNNVFNRHEFHLFGLGEIVEPGVPCVGCYKQRFDDQCPVADCMAQIPVGEVCAAVLRQLDQAQAMDCGDPVPAAVAGGRR